MKEKIVPPSLRVFFGFDSTRLLNMVLDRIGKHGLLDGVIVRLRFNHGMVSRLRFDETTLLRPINPDGKLAAPSTWRVGGWRGFRGCVVPLTVVPTCALSTHCTLCTLRVISQL